ncbi:aldehyde dehydrogenase [Ramlibacter sp. USB13]|uniref:4-(hydroxymethyl)benzenesulfonate dehydrogenase n=1 Tax=Ramlibacter cellulosilyticus TaxID=2764187 RepID=A0A923MKV0_9BURK|nr:aldehyde dehydrogenase family protein [Ramlibacter cellulosilyticus]MBC5781472.1 aldehyde dehydrogenase [Ramlibacter cellulosilyticus]
MTQTPWNHHIGGAFVAPAGGQHLSEIDPRTGEASFRIARGDASDIDRAVQSAAAAVEGWRSVKALDRARVLQKIAVAIRASADELARIEQVETGKPLPQARVDIEIAAQYFEFYGGLAPAIEGETIDIGSGKLCYTLKEPYGVIGVITPWNAPINQAARAAAPALAAGNAVVVKPSEFTSVSSLRLAEIAVACGLPAGALNVVTGTGLEAGAALVDHPLVAKIAFTGSLRAGREIGIKAAGRILPVTLELGGKSPDIVFADADLEAAARGAARGFTVNAGQACIAGTRILVDRSVRDRFVALLKAEVEKLKVGAGDDCQVGPIITAPQFAKVGEYLGIAREEGAQVVTGGKVKDAKGYFVEPTVLAGLPEDSRVVREEIFGPVCAVLDFENEADAIRMANDTNYGLAAGLWTQNLSRAHRVAARLQAGQVYVNEYPSGGVETPFGGYKQSGIGREKGREALAHYVQLKTVIVTL